MKANLHMACPYCGAIGPEYEVSLNVFAMGDGWMAKRVDEDAPKEIKSEAKTRCDDCKKEYMYRLYPTIRVQTAKLDYTG